MATTVWVLKRDVLGCGADGVARPATLVYGSKGRRIAEDDATPDWYAKHGYKSVGAALRQRRIGMRIDEVEVPDIQYTYEIYRCYEIIIRDKDGNQVGDAQYWYGTRKGAEDLGDHELQILSKK